MDWKQISQELQKPLDPRHVKPPPQGKYGNYVDGYHVVSEANRIFGEDGWSYEITDMRQVSRVECTDSRGNPQVRVGYYCAVKAYVNGSSFKHGAAVGSGMAKPENEADAHESAVKEAETDALKRSLRTYGNTFGLALYDKTGANVRVDVPPPNFAAIRDRIKQRIERCVSQDDLAAVWKAEQPDIKLLERDDPPKFGELVAAKDEAKAKLQPHTPAPQQEMPGAFVG